MRLPLKKSLFSFIKNLFSIFRVNEFMVHLWVAPLLRSDAEVFQPATVNEVEVSIRQIRVNKCRSCIYEIAILLLTVAQRRLRPIAFNCDPCEVRCFFNQSEVLRAWASRFATVNAERPQDFS